MKLLKVIKAGCKFLINSNYRFLILSGFGKYNYLTDEEYLGRMFEAHLGYKLDLNNPELFNEKIQWLKLYDRRPEYTMMVDKYRVKQYVADKIGEQYIIPTLGAWDSPEDIEFEKLPDKFVLKCNHNSGLGMCICKDKSKLNTSKVKRNLYKGLKQNYYLMGREWPYKDVPRKIIAEKYMVDGEETELKDYKVFNFDGEPRLIQVDYDRFSNHKRNLYSVDWEYIDAQIQYPTDSSVTIRKPDCLNEMLELARKLSEGYPHVRTDFYIIDRKIYFGELTFYHGSGIERIDPYELEKQMGDWLNLPPVDVK